MSIFSRANILAYAYRKLVHKFYANDIWIEMRLRAKHESVKYAMHHMTDGYVACDRYDLLRHSLKQANKGGLVLEFGVEKGLSINWLAKLTSRRVHGFDSFQGLPNDWRGTQETKGSFSMRGKPPRIAENVTLHIGWFDETLPKFLNETAGQVALVHIDCDIYEFTRTVFQHLAKRIVAGTIIVFDEYFNYPGWKNHEYKALQEFTSEYKLRYKYIGFSAEKGHVAVEIL